MCLVFNDPCLSLNNVEICLSRCDSIKYAAYRTAAKLRIVQKAFHMDKVHLKIVSGVFERHQLYQTENSVQLDQKELESVLYDIYFMIKKENDVLFNENHISHLLYKFLLNVYDRKKSNTIQVFSFKVGLSLLCNAKPREKYRYMFEQLADHNNCLSRKKLEIMLKKIIRLTEYLGEELSFGSALILGTIESCFQNNTGALGISEEVFMNWLVQDPQLLVWLSTLYRLQISETVTHIVKCEICKIYPLSGLRYRCLRCLFYNMCQSCFFTGRVNKRHKLKHPVQEYCSPMTSQQSTKAFLLTVKNKMYKTQCKLQYLPALRVDSNEAELLGQSTWLLDEMEISSKTVINGSRISLHQYPLQQLRNIITQLERESEKIIPQIEEFCLRAEQGLEKNEDKIHLKNFLMKHKTQVKTQVQKLKLLRNYLVPSVKTETKTFVASTPVVDQILSISQEKSFTVDLNNLSPISARIREEKKSLFAGKKMMWDNYDLGVCGLNPSWVEVQEGNFESSSFKTSSKDNSAKEAARKDDGSEVELSTWLGGRTPRELESSSREGISWLYGSEKAEPQEEAITEENKQNLKELQSDLKKILKKLQELTIITSPEEVDEKEIMLENKTEKEMDAMLADLIQEIEKLVGS